MINLIGKKTLEKYCIYTVKKGDSLWSIAKKFYGKPYLWPNIYKDNKLIIGDNPNLIIEGMNLFIDKRFIPN